MQVDSKKKKNKNKRKNTQLIFEADRASYERPGGKITGAILGFGEWGTSINTTWIYQYSTIYFYIARQITSGIRDIVSCDLINSIGKPRLIYPVAAGCFMYSFLLNDGKDRTSFLKAKRAAKFGWWPHRLEDPFFFLLITTQPFPFR